MDAAMKFFIIKALYISLVITRSDCVDYEGCFDLTYSIDNNYHNHIPNANLASCVNYCLDKDTRYAGVEKSDSFCYCGDDIVDGSVRRDDALCNVPCETANYSCGGDWLMSVYDIQDQQIHSDNETGSNVSFLIGISAGVRLYNSSNLDSYVTLMTTEDWAYTLDYHMAKNLVFVNTRGKLFKGDLKKSSEPKLIKNLQSSCDGFTVDWVNDQIFWAECKQNKNAVMQMDLEGNNVKQVVRQQGNSRSIKRMEIDPYVGLLFWVAEGTIQSCDTSGDNYNGNFTNTNNVVRGIALDISAQRLYFAGSVQETNPLSSIDYRGHNIRRHFTAPQLTSVFGLGVYNRNAFWINYATSKDILYMAPIQANGHQNIKTLVTVDKAVWHMRLVHPDLQKPPSGDPCSKLSCSHTCLQLSPNSAKCTCPSRMTLSSDNTTCLIPGGTVTDVDSKIESFVGCFDISYGTTHGLQHRISSITLGKCIDFCQARNVQYAGILANEHFCYCGSDIAEQSQRAPEGLCPTTCSDDTTRSCGGFWFMSLYRIKGNFSQSNATVGKNETSVNFLIGLSMSTRVYNSINMNKFDNVIYSPLFNEWNYCVDYHLAKNLVFSSSKKRLYKSSLTPKTGGNNADRQLVHMKNSSSCEGFAVDWVHDRIYWADCSSLSLTFKAMDLDGQNMTTVFERPGEVADIKRMEVDPYRGFIFWLYEGTLESFDISRTMFWQNMSGPGTVRGLALDLEAGRVYYSNNLNDATPLLSMNYRGGAQRKHFQISQMSSVYGLGVHKGYVYWANYANMDDMIYKAPINLTSDDSVVLLKTLDSVMWHMRLMHPDLQRRPARIINCLETWDYEDYDYECSVGVRSEPQKLEKSNVFGHVMVGVFLAAAVVVLALALLYLTDIKYWDYVRRNLPSVPYRREPNAAGEDNVNLI